MEVATTMRNPDVITHDHTTHASEQSAVPAPLGRHLARGAIGFGLIGSGFALAPVAGPATLLLGVPGFLALGGCPTCWIASLLETVSAGRLQRTCTDAGCELHTASKLSTDQQLPHVGR
jgi:hypothetical protein